MLHRIGVRDPRKAFSAGSEGRTGNNGNAVLHQKLLAQIGVSHLTTAEADADLDPVAVLQELLGIFDLGVQVVGKVTEVSENYDDEYELIITFGYSYPTLIQKVKRQISK